MGEYHFDLLKLAGLVVASGRNKRVMAQLMGMSEASYYLKTSGKREFTATEISTIINVLKCKPQDLFSQSELPA